jgi:putative ABC transport system permease protein
MHRTGLQILWGDTGKALAMVLGVAFSTLLMAQQAAIFVCLMNNSASHITAAQDADIWVVDERSDYFDDPGSLPTNLVESVRSVAGVEYATPYVLSNVILDSSEFVESGILIGIDTLTYLGMPQNIVEGSLRDLRADNTFAIDKRGYGDIWPDEPVVLGRELEVNNQYLRLVAIMDPPSPFISMPLIYTDLSNAALVRGRSDSGYVLVRAQDPAKAEALAERITEATGFKALTKEAFSQGTVDYYMKNTGIPINFFITIMLGFIVGLAVVAQTFYLFITENIRNLGVMKAMGATGFQLSGMTLVQCLLIAVIGFSLGIAGTAYFFETVPAKVPAFKGFFLPWGVIEKTAYAIFGISLFAGFVSVQRALRFDPALVLRG